MEDLVPLSADHPGFLDAAYRARRNAIAQIALDYRVGQDVPDVSYTADENAVWKTVWEHLAPLHVRLAAPEYLASQGMLQLGRDRIPQLAEVNRRLSATSRFEMHPVAGLVTAKGFLEPLGTRRFLSTQYMRHPSVPLYTPEPDVVHELIGHAATLAHPLFVDLSLAFGRAASQANEQDLKRIERVYWYSLEFGLSLEQGHLKAFGAGLLSSFGELGRIESEARHLPWNVDRVAETPYDPTRYQDTLFVAEKGLASLARELTVWLGKWAQAAV